ncbi:cupredoxin domain-containing protein [Arthrobacter echini]|uniref:cupredoxin domain-containing protein n=1 Tax=Arthrobacter echini TaxID=1529066 RepID=UPI001455F6CF|nr:cupredoxin domain-containing protein [Arthrobacter echini]
MKTAKHALSAVVLAALVMGSTACTPEETNTTDPPEGVMPSSAAAAPMTSAPAMPTTEGPSASEAPASSDAAPAEEAIITIADFEYQMPESIAPGAEVTVTNEDDAPHTVTADGEGDFDVEVGAGETVTFTAPDEPGDYAVVCTYHPQMSGTLVIG